MDEKPASGGVGIGTMLLGAVLVAGTFLVLQHFQTKPPPPPPPDPEPAASAAKLSKPDVLPGGAKKEEAPAQPGDSLAMVKPSADFKEMPAAGPMANSPPEPPYVYQSDGGPDRMETRVVRRRSDWDAIWKGLGGHDMPAIDFEKYMGLVIFGGKRPAGTTIDIASNKTEGGRIVVKWRAVPPRAPAQGYDHPVKAILVPRLPTAPSFKEVK